MLGSGPIVVRAYFVLRLRTVTVKFENMEALFDIASIEPTMVVVHNKRGYKNKYLAQEFFVIIESDRPDIEFTSTERAN